MWRLTMIRYLNHKLVALPLFLLVWSCAHYGQDGSLLSKAGRQEVQSYLSSRSEAYYHFTKSRQLLYQNRIQEALEELEFAAEADPEAPYLFAELASFYLRQGESAKALAAAERARNLDPSSIRVRMMLAGLYGSLNQPELAIAEYKEVLKLDPTEQKALLWLASLYAAEGQYAEAAEVLKRPFHRRGLPRSSAR